MMQKSADESSGDEQDKMLWKSLEKQRLIALDEDFERIAGEDDYNYISDEGEMKQGESNDEADEPFYSCREQLS
jgi:hypothetical protein